jgi:uncharacterized protein YdhG (YjbR/CyaY superfamily)
MQDELSNFYLQKEEPTKGALFALREIILAQDQDITAAWKYGMPFFCYKGKMFCYLWVHKKHLQPYIGFVEGGRLNHPKLLQEKRSRMKIMLFDPNEDLPIETINSLIHQAVDLYKNGTIKVKQ